MTWLTLEHVVSGGAIGTGFGVVGFVVHKVWPVFRKVVHIVDDITGEEARPGVPARPGLMERISTIEHEVRPNGGGSIKDAVNRIEEVQAKKLAKLEHLESGLVEMNAVLSSHLDHSVEETDRIWGEINAAIGRGQRRLTRLEDDLGVSDSPR